MINGSGALCIRAIYPIPSYIIISLLLVRISASRFTIKKKALKLKCFNAYAPSGVRTLDTLIKRQVLIGLSQSHALAHRNPCKYRLPKVICFSVTQSFFNAFFQTSRRNSRRGHQINSYNNHNSTIRAKRLVPFALCFLVNPVFPVAHPRAVLFSESLFSRFDNGIHGKTGLTASPQGFAPKKVSQSKAPHLYGNQVFACLIEGEKIRFSNLFATSC